MVNLFSFGCHVIDRAYVRRYICTYASTDCMGGVGETMKRQGRVSHACLGKSTSLTNDFNIGHSLHRRKTSDWSMRDHVTWPNSKWRLYLHRLFIPVERRFIAASYELQMHIRIFFRIA